ncbi:hypothetical protein LCGC14_1669300 [marine sediment metagenome]|uniref:Uncharacterized protein n=1 Tax=marine sediment metagenome TaxID=412755 RepID=A0A0F9HSQ1_9ZZZZ
MTGEFREWWIVFFNSLSLIITASINFLLRVICLIFWIPTLGHSLDLLRKFDDFFPDVEYVECYSPSRNLIEFFYRDPWLSIDINTIVFDCFSIIFNKEKFKGNCHWERWRWSNDYHRQL